MSADRDTKRFFMNVISTKHSTTQIGSICDLQITAFRCPGLNFISVRAREGLT
jgi:hypothetical protein